VTVAAVVGSRAQSVDRPVDKSGLNVDDTSAWLFVHLEFGMRWTSDRLSSTAARVADASVSGDIDPLSPASTDAKTTDENLSSSRENDKNYKLVDSGDIPRPASAPALAPSSDGGMA
jgi:hypothetical protein